MPARTREKHVGKDIEKFQPRGKIFRLDKAGFMDWGLLTYDSEFGVLARISGVSCNTVLRCFLETWTYVSRILLTPNSLGNLIKWRYVTFFFLPEVCFLGNLAKISCLMLCHCFVKTLYVMDLYFVFILHVWIIMYVTYIYYVFLYVLIYDIFI